MGASRDPFGRTGEESAGDAPRSGLPPWLLPMLVVDVVIVAVVLIVFVF